MLYEMLVGSPPFIGPTPQAVIAQGLTAPRPQASKARPEVPLGIERVVLRAMAADPAERYPDMEAFARLSAEPAAR